MYYYYDVLLNFAEDKELYAFYEWEEKDTVDFIKKIPLFRVSSHMLKEQLKYRTKFKKEFLELIKNKTILKEKGKSIQYSFLISDTKEALALELDGSGTVIARSKLLISDEINLTEMMYSMRETKIEYEKLETYEKREEIRQIEKIKKLIKCEIDTLYKSNNQSKLKYLYYEWFNKKEEDIDTILKTMYIHLQKEYSPCLTMIYDLIKMSYNK